jgi:hypothetical protein
MANAFVVTKWRRLPERNQFEIHFKESETVRYGFLWLRKKRIWPADATGAVRGEVGLWLNFPEGTQCPHRTVMNALLQQIQWGECDDLEEKPENAQVSDLDSLEARVRAFVSFEAAHFYIAALHELRDCREALGQIANAVGNPEGFYGTRGYVFAETILAMLPTPPKKHAP